MEILIEGVEELIDFDLERLRQLSEQLLKDAGYQSKGVNIIFVNDNFIQGLNRRYRQVDSPTDVLCFDLSDPLADDQKAGEVYVSLERAVDQAQEYGVSAENEVARLVVHGLLHLVGYDDQTEADQEVMHQQTERYLSRFGIE